MSANSKIEWCDHTFNPWIGCTKVSPGCANCYAEGESKRRGWAQWGKGKERHRTSANYWKQPLIWNRQAYAMNLNGFLKPRVFCASLADWLDDEVPIEWLADLLELIALTPNLDWLLLTKRPENFKARVSTAICNKDPLQCYDGSVPENVWIGVSVEDQKRADERTPLLLQIPAKVRFLSCEPLLGPVHLGRENCHVPSLEMTDRTIDWVIIGGESGSRARPCRLKWIRDIVDQCQAASVPVFVKQLGARPYIERNFTPSDSSEEEIVTTWLNLNNGKGGDPSEWPEDLRIREFPTWGKEKNRN